MELRRGECSFCGQWLEVVANAPDAKVLICAGCSMTASESFSRAEFHKSVRIEQLSREWLLVLAPIAIVVVAVALQPYMATNPAGTLLRGIGAIASVSIVAGGVWQLITRRWVRPKWLAPVAWALCGGYIGAPLGVIAAIIASLLGVTIWFAFNRAFSNRDVRSIDAPHGSVH